MEDIAFVLRRPIEHSDLANFIKTRGVMTDEVNCIGYFESGSAHVFVALLADPEDSSRQYVALTVSNATGSKPLAFEVCEELMARFDGFIEWPLSHWNQCYMEWAKRKSGRAS
jgi:hypothetical protein